MYRIFIRFDNGLFKKTKTKTKTKAKTKTKQNKKPQNEQIDLKYTIFFSLLSKKKKKKVALSNLFVNPLLYFEISKI